MDDKFYNSIVKWANEFLKKNSIQNLTGIDLVNEAYINIVDKNLIFDESTVKKEVKGIFWQEKQLVIQNDTGWLEFGQNNPSYKRESFDTDKVCKDCHELKPLGSFGIKKYKKSGYEFYSSYCFECERIRNKKNYRNPNRKKGVNNTGRINVYNEYGEIILVAQSIMDLHIKSGISTHHLYRLINKGKRYKNIFRYVETMHQV